MKVDRVILNSTDNTIFNTVDSGVSNLVNALLGVLTSNQITSNKQYTINNTSKITHNLERFLEKPKRVRIAKVALNGSIPSFNEQVNGLKMFKRHWQNNVNDPLQNSTFEINMDTTKVFNTFAEFNTEFNSKINAVDSTWTSTIDNETGKITINKSGSSNFEAMVIDTRLPVLRKFGFLYPTFMRSVLGFPMNYLISNKSVELAQSSKIFIRSNLEPNTYCSNGERLLGFIPYTLDIKDLSSGGFCYVNPSDDFIEIQEKNIDLIDIEFLDESMNLMNFASMPVSVELQFQY